MNLLYHNTSNNITTTIINNNRQIRKKWISNSNCLRPLAEGGASSINCAFIPTASCISWRARHAAPAAEQMWTVDKGPPRHATLKVRRRHSGRLQLPAVENEKLWQKPIWADIPSQLISEDGTKETVEKLRRSPGISLRTREYEEQEFWLTQSRNYLVLSHLAIRKDCIDYH